MQIKNKLNIFFDSTLEDELLNLKSEIPHTKLNQLLKIIQNQNNYINNLFGKMRKLGLFINDVENNRVFPNDLWYKLGYTDKEMLNLGFMDLVHPDDLQKIKDQSIIPASQGKHVNKIVFRFHAKNGSWHWLLSTTISITTDKKGFVKQYIGFDSDITEEMELKTQLEKALKLEKEAVKKAVAVALESQILGEISSIITSSLGLKKTIEAILEQAEKVIPYDTASVQILKEDHLEIIGGRGWKKPDKIIGHSFPIPGDNPNTSVMKTMEPLIINNISTTNFHFPYTSEEYKGKAWIGIPLIMGNRALGMITFDKNEVDFFTENHIKLGKTFASHVSIALENARIYEHVKELAAVDPLTGAKNRRAFFEYASRQEKLYKRYGTEFSLIMLDIDFFKKINDNYGHQTGDSILKDLVSVIPTKLRDSDYLCRYGGEEFAIILPQSDESEAYKTAERIREAVETQVKIKGTAKTITVSIGCAGLNTSKLKNVDDVISMADKALYYVKNNGRNQSKRYSTMDKG